MLLRAEQAQWFETYIPHDKTVVALEALAGSGEIELESDPNIAIPLDLSLIQHAIQEFHDLENRYKYLFADILPQASPLLKAPEQLAKDSIDYLKAWCQASDKLLTMQLRLESKRQALLLLQECLAAMAGHAAGFPQFAHPSAFLYKGIFACPQKHHLDPIICAAVDQFFPGSEHNFFLVADLPSQQRIIEQAYQSGACLHVSVPGWLSQDPAQQKSQVVRHLDRLTSKLQRLVEKLAQHQQQSKLAQALANMQLLAWYAKQAQSLSTRQTYCHVTGWTKLKQPAALQQLLKAKDIQASVLFTAAPETYKPPINLILPAWARPFHLFVEMLGTPGRDEVDPILLIPITISLLFGYMFPDVGHGLMLLLLSTLLYRRWPEGRFLIACGFSSILFGVVFGEFFGLEGLLEPLWIKPLEEPLLILLPPLLLGVVLMLVGLVFNGIEAVWRNQITTWLLQDAAVLVMYAAACIGIFYPSVLWVVALALGWFVGGQLILHTHNRLVNLLSRLAMLVQSLFELLLNTFSFLRVGAFALAHAALSTAVMQMAEGIDNQTMKLVFLIIGHLLIVGIEGLVVFVQTTRLILFEFFTRFLKAEGRIFRPLTTTPENKAN